MTTCVREMLTILNFSISRCPAVGKISSLVLPLLVRVRSINVIVAIKEFDYYAASRR